MAKLKGVIFSLRNVILREGSIDGALFGELVKLVQWLRSKDILPVFVANSSWSAVAADGTERDFKDVAADAWGASPWYIADRNEMPYKPKAAAMEFVLKQHGWQPHEALYVGNTRDDMITARNGKLLFLNALWHGIDNPYGFQFDSPRDIARFIDCFCLGFDDWFWALEAGDLRVYALAPFTTMSARYEEAKQYSVHARDTAKMLGGDPIFWGRLLAASVYHSGLSGDISYITSYPGHSPTSASPVINGALKILGDSMGKNFIHDLIIRHTKAEKSQTLRMAGKAVEIRNQINSICLNPNPTKNSKGERYANSPLGAGKTVLVVDDFCTAGNAFEAARAYIQATGAKTISLAWLKTISTDYSALHKLPPIDPYRPNTIDKEPARVQYWYSKNIRNNKAIEQLAASFECYPKWNWK